MGHKLRSALDAKAERVVVQIDFTNAFGSVYRAVLIVAAVQLHPQIPTLCKLALWRAHQSLGDAHPILSQKSVHQSNPLGRLLLGVVLLEPTCTCRHSITMYVLWAAPLPYSWRKVN
jgi:hypothetical protein